MAFYPYARRSEIVIQAFDDESLIYDLNNHKAFHLNHTSALIYQFCDGNSLSAKKLSGLPLLILRRIIYWKTAKPFPIFLRIKVGVKLLNESESAQ
jgi:hypothetical protein